MANAADEFARFAELFPEPLLLVSSSGHICGASRRAREQLFGGVHEIANRPLSDFSEDPPEKILGYLKLCSRSSQRLPGAIRLGSRIFHCAGLAFDGHDAQGRRLVLLQVKPREESIIRFVALNQRIEQLTSEVALRMRAESSANEQRAILQVTLSSIGDAVITTDSSGIITFMNPTAELQTGWTHSEAVGRPLNEIFVIQNEQTGRPVESPVQKVLDVGVTVGLANHTSLIRKDGTAVPIDDTAAPIRTSTGELLGVVLVFHEISERRKLDLELRRQAEALREADRRKDEFLAMLAHELRNPLAPLWNCIQLLRVHQRHGVDLDQLAEVMARQTSQLRRLVDDLLDIARITRGTIQLKTEPIALAAVIEHAIETVRPLIDEREHRLTVMSPPNTVVVDADLTRMSQVLCNLLTNAAKYTSPRGEIAIAGFREGDKAVISVRDNGTGLEAEFLPSIFELFTQSDRSLDRQQGGLGIGLTLVKSLVQMHGGDVSASSEGTGKGSEFIVRLPIVVSSQQRRTPAQADEEVRLRRQVLIVDDNRDAAESLAMLLQTWGCDTRVVFDSTSALRTAHADVPEAILLDIGLPGMDGYEVSRRLRQSSALAGTQIIAVTGYGSDVDRKRAEEAGFDHYLTKPVDHEKLAQLLGK